MIFDLEKVEAINELLTSTNQVRDEFRKKFRFPLVLWITDSLNFRNINRFRIIIYPQRVPGKTLPASSRLYSQTNP
ncbi:hypothetical protein AFK68_18705 [Hydrocoleum sp. CS-953]|uniref:hypothetical protein n=2 Tax=Microcoleaceae TaxID=1892252 RepID=UPI000B9B1109|nr:hypothetical protein [Hydrocoleum sp. CS-953]OZH53271.1 hypothetical protein AFK68_18705 [Hydrocoleum sp. CS-953]